MNLSSIKRVFHIGISEKVLIVIFLVMIQLLCLWGIDISVSAMLSEGVITNGFNFGNPTQTYHIGLYGIVLSTFIMVIIVVSGLFPKIPVKKEPEDWNK